jgi:hypothetical protein
LGIELDACRATLTDRFSSGCTACAVPIAPVNDSQWFVSREICCWQQYHQPGDNYDASMDFGNMPEDALLLATLGYVVADTPAWPDWHGQSEFKPVRDRIQDREF